MHLKKILLVKKVLLAAIALGATLHGPSAFARDIKNCKEPPAGSNTAPLISPPRGNVVVGTGRLQFYSAPSVHCAMKGVFVVPGDNLISYAQTDDGWVSVMYVSPKSADSVTGWVRGNRLRNTGTMGPTQ
ncbi:hypothetical protein [Methylocystis sp. SB2]|uniref:hypothetical protein n=1 Tax=Methylocystis sp. (strain SB2) TaxID=743836 RepID=UPI0004273954|nr:hypothetical protein [Methylocystis sp. SB2]ULO23175.1 hypothetical protein LNB28_13615 [Methylocystis sp. SB2]